MSVKGKEIRWETLVEYQLIHSREDYSALIAISLLGALLVLFMASVLLASENMPPPIVLGVLILFLSLTAIPLLVGIRNTVEERKAFTALEALLSTITAEEIMFQRPVSYWAGIMETAGRWYSTGRSRTYRSETRFHIHAKGPADRISLGHVTRHGYTIAVNSRGEGYMELPVIGFHEPQLRDLHIILVPRARFTGGEVKLSALHEAGDTAILELRVEGDRLRGTLSYTAKNRSRAARVELEADITGIPLVRRITLKKTIAVTREPTTLAIDYPLNPRQPVAIAMWGRPNPHRILKALRETRIKLDNQAQDKAIMYGYRKGEYRVKLVLDIPLQRDVVASTSIAFRTQQ